MRYLMRARGVDGAFCVTANGAFYEWQDMRFAYHYDKFGAAGDIDAGGSTEPKTRSKISDFLRGSSVFFDIGAHEGLFAISAKKLNPEVLIHAFEPQPAALKENLSLNRLHDVRVHEVAVGERAGRVAMTTDQRSSNHVTSKAGDIPLVALDDIDLPAPTLIKLDIEGFELEALKGARKLLLSHHPIVVTEINHCFLRYNESLKPFYEFMSSLGYSFNRLTDGKLVEIKERPDRPDELPRSADDNYWWIASSAAYGLLL